LNLGWLILSRLNLGRLSLARLELRRILLGRVGLERLALNGLAWDWRAGGRLLRRCPLRGKRTEHRECKNDADEPGIEVNASHDVFDVTVGAEIRGTFDGVRKNAKRLARAVQFCGTRVLTLRGIGATLSLALA
jgi:hypothetical protein